METQLDKNIFYINKKFFYLLVILLIAIVAGSYYFYTRYQNSQKLLRQSATVSQGEAENIVASVGSLMQLPKNENPTIATVSDKEKLKGQPFFANAQNGDKVLIYTKAKKAILYRPSANKIIEVSFLNPGVSSIPTPISEPSPTPTLTPIPVQ